MANEMTIQPGYLRRLVFKMRAVSLGDEDTPRDARDNAVFGTHHITLKEEVGVDPTRAELVAEIDGMDPEHQQELVALMWVGRGDFDATEWRETLTLAAERADTPTSGYLLSHAMAADYIVSGLEELGYDHILLDGTH
jgi:hypothetical protein